MAKQLNVNLGFTADTSAAEANIRKLQQSLTQLSSIKAPIGTSLTKDMQTAVNSAKDLQMHLNNAFNVKTGNFDLTALNQSLRNSGQSLSDLTSGLLKAGVNGEQAFMNVQRAIASSSVQINKAQGLLGNFLTTLKNTARWQISSSILHGFMGSIQSAYRYAQDLDESLNNIRIVTGQNTEQMARFAEQANKAAKALSSTTTDYTNASLIYYQQGLNDSEVVERTNITIKMANAAGESAEKVSDQLTAVWNNFAKGGENLEYYADVMTALGAATASSTDEIAEGLEKFAAVADTVGLSYEYATSALATVTATTRQSADVVGTAFKTLFARIQDLELGETLDDGTTLGTYSEALMKVGISIKDMNGQMKDMDTILNEMGSKWKGLNKDQQVALAQQVAGVRQYTQLVALMDNWDYFQENLGVAQTSSGELQKQADIYAESWEAARDKVTASLEGLYNDLIPTDFIISMTNAFADVIEGIDGFVSAIGGLPTILLMISSIALNKMGPSIADGINMGISKITDFGQKISTIDFSFKGIVSGVRSASTGTAELTGNIDRVANGLKTTADQTQYFKDSLEKSLGSSSALAQNQQSIAKALNETNLSNSFQGYLKDVSQVYNLQGLIEQSKSRLTNTDREQLSIMQEQVLQAAERKAKEQETLDLLTLQQDRLRSSIDSNLFNNAGYNEGNNWSSFETSISTTQTHVRSLMDSWNNFMAQTKETDIIIETINGHLLMSSGTAQGMANAARESAGIYQDTLDINSKINEILNNQDISVDEKRRKIHEIITQAKKEEKISKEVAASYHRGANALKEGGEGVRSMNTLMSRTAGEARTFAQNMGNSTTHLDRIEANVHEVYEQQMRTNTATAEHETLLQRTVDRLTQAASRASTFGGMLSKAFSGFSTIAMGINSVSNAINTLKDDEAGFGQKLTATAMGLTMGFSALTTVMKGVSASIGILQAKKLGLVTANELLAASNMKEAVSTEMRNAVVMKGEVVDTAATAAKVKEILVSKLKINADKAETLSQQFANIAKEQGTAAAIKQTIANIGLAASEYAILWPLLIIVGVIAALAIGFAIWDAATVSAAEALETAKEQAKEASEAFEEAKNAADELKSAFDHYDEIATALDDCVEGTEEWTEALKANNQEVLSLMQKYPQLAGMVNEAGEAAITRDEKTGALKVADWAMEDMQEAADKAVINAQSASIRANQNVRDAQLRVDKEDLENDFRASTAYTYAMKNTRDESGTITGGYNVGDQVATYIMDNVSSLSKMTRDEQIDALNKYFKENDITGYAEGWVDRIEELGPDFTALATSIDANTAAIEAENKAIVSNLLADNETVQESDYVDQITKISSEDYDKAVDAQVAALEKEGWGTNGISKATGVNAEARKIFEEYAKVAGITDYDLTDTTGTDKNRNFVYSVDGNEKTVSLETMKSVVAASKANEELANNANQLVNTFTKLADNGAFGDAGVAAATAASTGNFENLTLSQLSGGYNIEELSKQLTEEDLKALGFESATEFINAFNETVKKGENAWPDLMDGYVQTIQDQMTTLKDGGKLNNLTLEQSENLANTLNTAFINGGKEASQNITDMFNATGEDADELADTLNKVDWQTTNVKDLKDTLYEAGVTTQFTDEQLQKLIDTLSTTEMTVAAATEQYASLHKIIDGLNSGDNISAEDYQALGAEYQEYFTLMADGTYKLTGDALDFYQAVHGNTIENFKSIIDSSQAQAEMISGLASYGIGSLGEEAKTTHIPGTDQTEVNAIHLENQMDFLAVTGYDAAKVQEWREQMTAGTIDTKTLSEAVVQWTEDLGGAAAAEVALQNAMALSSAQSYEAQQALASTASDMDELRAMYEDGTIGVAAYSEAVEAAHNQEKWEGLDTKEVQEYADHLMETAEASEILSDDLKDNEEAAEDVAAYTKKMNRGIETLAEGFDDWSDVLKKSDKSSEEYADAMKDMKSAMSDVLGVQEDFLSDDFILENMEDIEKAAEGDAAAIDRLAIAAGKDIIVNVGIEDENVLNEVLNLHNELAAQIPDIEVGATINDVDFLTKAAQIVEQAGMTVDQANAYFRSMGFEPTFETKKVPVTRTLKGTRTYTDNVVTDTIPTSSGDFTYIKEMTQRSEEVDMGTVEEEIEVPAMTTDGGKPNFTLTRTNAGSMNNYSSSNSGGGSPGGGGGGGGSEPKTIDKTKKSDVVERYKQINDLIDDSSRAMDKASKAADRLYGAARIKKMREANRELQNEIGLLEQKRIEAQGYLDDDLDALNEAASKAGISFDIENGNIANYESQMTELYNQLKAAEDSAMANGNVTDTEQERIDAIQEKIDAVTEAIEQYDETKELLEDIDDEIEEKFYEWQDNNYEMLTYELEVKVEINDMELEKLEYYLDKMDGNFYQMAEAAQYMYNTVNPILDTIGNYAVLDESGKVVSGYIAELDEAYAKGEISQDAYIEGLKESYSAIYDQLSALNELDKDMQAYYGDTVDAAKDELATYTDRMEHLTSVLDHYQNLLELTGRQKDYDNMGKVLRGRAQTIEDQAKVSKATYEMFANQAKELKEQMEAAEGTDNYDFIRQQWLAAQEAAEETQDQMLSDAAEWAEAMKAAIENELAGLADVLENALTAEFGSFDYMAQKMERAESLQEEYLTTTNKIYETTKLMRTAQNAIDTTTNTVAKQRLKNFINETAELQNQTKLSEYELEIQQAKYDLLLAEIALEEAQQAKSTVRLQRDSEGNFGYVYTADQDKVAQAQQELEDAQNSLYNIALEGANSYTQKYQEALAAMYDELTELQEQWLNGEITTQQEYNEKMQAIQDHYYETLKNYSSLYQVAITTDSRVVADAWSSDFADMTLETDKWMNAVNDYVDECEDKFIEWQKVIQDVETYAGVDLDNLAGAVKGITDESKTLEKTLTDPKNGVIKGLNDELNSVRTVTEAYLAQRTAILETVAALERYLTALGQKIAAESQAAGDDNNNDNNKNNNNSGNNNNNNNGKSGSAKSQAADIIRGVHSGSIPVTSGGWIPSAQSQGYSSEAIQLARQALNDSKPGGGYSYDYNKALQLVGYDTGGYTGQWGPEGKLALLHEKEIVLNAKDTENLLASMDILHNIIDVIDMQAMSAQMGGLLRSPSLMQSDADVLEQHVTIEANFPAVTSRIEIEEAFDNLINKASQYANRK